MRGIYFIVLLFAFFLSKAQIVQRYGVADSLLGKSQAIIRYDSLCFTVTSASTATTYRKQIITILKPLKKDLAEFYLDYSEFNKVTLLSANVYDRNGLLVRKIKDKDIQDISLTGGGTMASDFRAQYIDMRSNSYPYTVEIAYEEKLTGSMFYPDWMPLSDFEVSLEKAVLICRYPKSLPVRFLEKNVEDHQISPFPEGEQIKWQVQNIPSKSAERFSVGLSSIVPTVYLAPKYFEMAGYRGDLTTWNSYGHWVNGLMEGRSSISIETQDKMKALTAGLATDEEKIWKVYEYMQQNTRYISIQLGIGGWQPFEASFVDEKKYGDCKALSNYTRSLLLAVDIPSNYTLIRGGYKAEIDPAFPSAHFNHVILCVPNKGDTIWLECTSQTNPVGYQGSFTGNRYALVVNESGGYLRRTKSYPMATNVETTSGMITLGENTQAIFDVAVQLKGMEIENGGFDNVLYSNDEEKNKWLKKYFNLSSMEIDSLQISFDESPLELPSGRIKTNFSAKNCYKVTGSRILLNPNLFNHFPSITLPKTPRETPIEHRYGYVQEDSLTFLLPKNYYSEAVPKDVAYQSQFGSYTRTISVQDQKVTYHRKFTFKEGIFASSEYESFASFLKSIAKFDGEMIVFLNKT